MENEASRIQWKFKDVKRQEEKTVKSSLYPLAM